MNQKVIINCGSISELKSIVQQYNKKNIFLVRGKNSFEKSGAKNVLDKLLIDNYVTEYSDFSVNPKFEEAEIGHHKFKNSNSDLIIAVGGGSVIDMAKLIKYFFINENIDTELPFIAIPTTAGTGSEATCFAVVYKNDVKESIESELILPNHAIVDAHLLSGQSHYQMAVSGIDAFAQGLESYWNIHATDESMLYAEEAMKLMWENLELAIAGDLTALNNICKGSHLAGKAINITKTTAPHALSYGFTSNFNLPHGHAVALFVPYFVYLHKHITANNCIDKIGVSNVNNKMHQIAKILNIDYDVLEVEIISFFNRLEISVNFLTLNLTYEDFIKGTSEINYNRLSNNPHTFNNDYLSEIYNFNNKFDQYIKPV